MISVNYRSISSFLFIYIFAYHNMCPLRPFPLWPCVSVSVWETHWQASLLSLGRECLVWGMCITCGRWAHTGPKHLACVEFAGGQPQWKRRARARYPSEDPENVTMLAKAEYVDKEEDPGRSPSVFPSHAHHVSSLGCDRGTNLSDQK